MTENRLERRSPSGQVSRLWMATAFIIVAAFLVWLGANSAPSSVGVVEGTEEEESSVASVTLEEFATAAETYTGQVVRLAGAEVASPLGPRAFWISLPTGDPFLAMLDDGLAAAGVSVAHGEALVLVGTVKEMSEAILAAWDEAGFFEDEGQRMQAEFATMFIEVTTLERLGDAEA